MEIEENVLFSSLTTVGIGGPAKYLVRVQDPEELPQAIQFAKGKKLPFTVIGGASNLLVSDDGYPGVIIKMENSGISPDYDTSVIVQSGTPLQDLVDYTIEHSLEGIQRMTGIPGTVGGAIHGNAGAYGQMIGDSLVLVRVYDLNRNKFDTLTASQCGFSYRQSNFSKNNLVVLHSVHQFNKGDKKALKKEASETLSLRQQKYKPGLLCPGSFFKNYLTSQIPQNILDKLPPREDTYGKTPAFIFLEQLGAKGDRIGDIQIAPFHANLIVNLDRGTAKDFWKLSKKWFDKVKKAYGIELEPEVQFINLPPLNL